MIEIAYCREIPSNQSMIDIFNGYWLSAFPEEYQINAGNIRHFDFAVDPRVQWAAGIIPGGIHDLTVLELGPFEAYNTWQLDKLGARSILSIESNNLNFLKCLIVKEITGLKANFLYGDFLKYLEQCTSSFDIVWASGVLYHQVEPLKLIGLIAKVTNKVFLHTHYYDKEVMARHPDIAANFIPTHDIVAEYLGYRATLHYRSYEKELAAQIFAGGSERYS